MVYVTDRGLLRLALSSIKNVYLPGQVTERARLHVDPDATGKFPREKLRDFLRDIGCTLHDYNIRNIENHCHTGKNEVSVDLLDALLSEDNRNPNVNELMSLIEDYAFEGFISKERLRKGLQVNSAADEMTTPIRRGIFTSNQMEVLFEYMGIFTDEEMATETIYEYLLNAKEPPTILAESPQPEEDTEVITNHPVVEEVGSAPAAAADTADTPDLAVRRAAPAKKFPCCTIV